MVYNNLTYVIIDSSEVSSVDFSKIKDINSTSLRKSVDGSKAIVKYDGDQPSFLNGKTTFSHEEMLNKINEADWLHNPEGI